ncbi:MAG TPA: hypothetical protein VM869_19285 [Enhygromyxa sp.]|nr:hypothetical protein [Enhygromyxa sp.]
MLTKILVTLLVTMTPLPELADALGANRIQAANACQSNYGCSSCRYWLGIWTCWGCSGCTDVGSCEGDVFSCGAGSCFTGSDSCTITSASDSCCGSGPNS